MGWPCNENVGDTALVVMLLELIGLKIVFDVDLRDVDKTPHWYRDLSVFPVSMGGSGSKTCGNLVYLQSPVL